METISNCESFESLSAACGKTGVRKEDNVQLQNVNSTIRVSFMVFTIMNLKLYSGGGQKRTCETEFKLKLICTSLNPATQLKINAQP